VLIKDDKFTIHKIRDIYKILKDDFESNNSMSIDMKNIDEIDLSGLQVLLSLKKSCDSQNKKFELINIKDEVLYAFELTGTNTVLGI